MNKFKRVSSLVLCLVLCSALLLVGVGCSEKRAAEYMFSPPAAFDVLETTSVAENDRFSLIWDAERRVVVLFDKEKNCEWSYAPEDAYNKTMYDYEDDDAFGGTVNAHPQTMSPIIVQYFTTANFQLNETNAYSMSIDKNTFTVQPIDNGLRMTCYFKDRELTVPVDFTLNEKGIDVSVDPTQIEENEMYNIYGIKLAPFFCSIANEDAGKDDYYLFTPSGSGTIINPIVDETKGAAENIVDSVYGKDANITTFEEKTVTENVRVPVFGAVNGDKAICAVIKDGAECAFINTTVAHKLMKYSNITAEFHIRGYQEVVQKLFTQTIVTTRLYTDAFTPDKIKVGYYPLYNDKVSNDASYVGMAKIYRDYLIETGVLTTQKSNDSLLNLKLVGGIKTREFHFGIPSDAMLSVTTLKQAANIVEDVKNRTNLNNINVNLIGFGESGNDVGVVAGNYDINSEFGDEDDLKSLINYCNNNGLNLFMNFDMVRFNESGGGVTTAFGKADAANGSYTENYYTSINLRYKNPHLPVHYLVSRTEFAEVAANIKEVAAEWGLPGISLDTLTSISYSDYSDKEYYARAHFDDQATAIINAYKTNGYKVAGSDANAFAAACCSHVYDAPTQSSKYRVYTTDVPFYQLVFKGIVSMSGTSLNLATDKQISLLKAAETGTGLTYTLIGEYNTNLITAAQNVFYGSVYWDDTIERGVATDIKDTVEAYGKDFESVNGATIIDHKLITNDVRCTTFSNGVKVYVNYNKNAAYTDEAVTVAPCTYQFVK